MSQLRPMKLQSKMDTQDKRHVEIATGRDSF